ncbi:MAG: pyridoxamine 5'-phosphate oxidase [Verrucomicrobiota bacterium]
MSVPLDRDDRIAALRREYTTRGLRAEELDADPIEQFRRWFREAEEAKLLEPNAMTLATANADGRVTARTVLLKAFDQRGFVFYTNYGSRKAKAMAENAQVSLLFAWLPLERQVAIAGGAEKISAAESLRYFASRPYGSQLGAWVSRQSEIITTRSLLEAKFEELRQKWAEGEVPLPDFWGGYRVVPQEIEFWQGAASRLHDRFAYRRENGGWIRNRLSP